MNINLQDTILKLSEQANPTPQQKAELINKWEDYFYTMMIFDADEQGQEFRAIMKARLQKGIISIIAPDVAVELGLNW